jgi:RNA-directed DNA polymerase
MESQEQIQHEEQLWERILSRSNLFKALERVRRNKGAPGVDGMTVDELPDHLRDHWEGIRLKLDNGTYTPSPVKRIAIPKASGGERQLGIPTVLDRLIQQAMHQVLTGVFEPTFSEHSYGFRPKRNAHQAVEQAREYQSEGYEWVVDIDLANFFDTVNHDRLMEGVKREVSDSRVLGLINAYLKTGILSEGLVSPREQGTPQGSPLSPLLSNIVLTELDCKLEERGHRFVRYADDCNIYVKSEGSAHRVMASTMRFIENRMRLKVNETKSAVDEAKNRKFLGFSFY